MRTGKMTAAAFVGLVLTATAAWANWNPGDGHKMHFPQLPDPNGWDIDVVPGNSAADDWRCSASGPVEDIHFWYSWEQDEVGIIDRVDVTIWSNIPAAESPMGFSIPGNPLWTREFLTPELHTQWYGEGTQGFFDAGGGWYPEDHVNYYQCNIVNIAEPFVQVKDSIYWLELSVLIRDPVATHIGWKTSKDHFMDTAVFRADPFWIELIDPDENMLDLAFVITPEPSGLALVLLGGLMLLRRR